MLFKQNLIRSIEEQLNLINLRISYLEAHSTIEAMDEANELYKERIHLELLKMDLEEGTHLLKIDELEKRIDVYSSKFQEAKNRFEREKLLQNHKGMRKETRNMKIVRNRIARAQALINYLDRVDDRKRAKSKAHTL